MPQPEYKRCPRCGRAFTKPPRRSATQWATMRFCSIGCARSWVARTHGATLRANKSPEYESWMAMKSRCLNPRATGYAYYGGRGITICERWRGSFQNFLSDMGERPKGTSLDRIDNDGSYEPANCRWATAKEQVANRRAKA